MRNNEAHQHKGHYEAHQHEGASNLLSFLASTEYPSNHFPTEDIILCQDFAPKNEAHQHEGHIEAHRHEGHRSLST